MQKGNQRHGEHQRLNTLVTCFGLAASEFQNESPSSPQWNRSDVCSIARGFGIPRAECRGSKRNGRHAHSTAHFPHRRFDRPQWKRRWRRWIMGLGELSRGAFRHQQGECLQSSARRSQQSNLFHGRPVGKGTHGFAPWRFRPDAIRSQ